MLMICEDETIRNRIRKCLNRLECPTDISFNAEELYEVLTMDKKAGKDTISVVVVDKIGEARVETRSFAQMKELLNRREAE